MELASITKVSFSQVLGLARAIVEAGGEADVARIAQDVDMDLDRIGPIVAAAEVLGLLTVVDGDLPLTEVRQIDDRSARRGVPPGPLKPGAAGFPLPRGLGDSRAPDAVPRCPRVAPLRPMAPPVGHPRSLLGVGGSRPRDCHRLPDRPDVRGGAGQTALPPRGVSPGSPPRGLPPAAIRAAA